MGDLMADPVRWGVAAIFYGFYVVGLVYFAISVGMGQGWQAAALNGALFGFFTYLTYNATALSVIRGFDSTLATVDTLWGAVMGAAVSTFTVLIMQALGRS